MSVCPRLQSDFIFSVEKKSSKEETAAEAGAGAALWWLLFESVHGIVAMVVVVEVVAVSKTASVLNNCSSSSGSSLARVPPPFTAGRTAIGWKECCPFWRYFLYYLCSICQSDVCRKCILKNWSVKMLYLSSMELRMDSIVFRPIAVSPLLLLLPLPSGY